MRQIPSVAASLFLIAAASFTASAQDNGALQPGARIKLITPRLDATHQMVKVLAVTADSLQFRSEAYPVSRTIALSEVSAIEVRSSGGRPFGRYMLIGTGVGGALGAGWAYAAHTESKCTSFCIFETSAAEDATLGAMFGGALGLVVGTAMASLQSGGRWTRIPLNGTVAFRPARGGRFALTISRPL